MSEELAVEYVEHATLGEALAAFQAELPQVRKANEARIPGKEGKTGYTITYADLADVTDATLPLLGRHGLAWSTRPTVSEVDGFAFVLEYRLLHGASGESIVGVYPLPDPTRTPAQGLGAAITYARRYCLTAVTGVAPGGDDEDAHSAPPQIAASPREPSRPRTGKTVDEWIAEAEAATDVEQLKRVWERAPQNVMLPSGETLGAAIRSMRSRFEKPAAPVTEWPTVQIPSELSEAEAAEVARFGLDVPEDDA